MSRPDPAAPVAAVPSSRLTRFADGLVQFIARHWLALFNLGWGLYVLLPFAAPLLLEAGFPAPARVIYSLYSYTCHQIPDHSYFLNGPMLAPDHAALVAAGMPDTTDLFVQRRFVGNEHIGHKVALCQRDVAIYGSVLLAGLLFALLRPIRPLSTRYFVLLALPMAIDGGTQMLGWHESTWWLRTLTGGLFGAGAVWWAYPYIDAAMRDLLATEQQRRALRAAPPGAPQS